MLLDGSFRNLFISTVSAVPRKLPRKFLELLLFASCAVSVAWADGGVAFQDFAADPDSGIAFERVRSERDAIFDEIKMQDFFIFPDQAAEVPHKPRGAPGVAIFDYDGDGDLDVYVTNGPGAANSLYSNQLGETGELGFVDVAVAVGAAATDQDSTGVCFGDIDNDGDPDLMVLGAIEPNRLFENRGGIFADVTDAAGVGGGALSTSSCSMGDFNGDGLLDVAVANTHTTWDDMLAIAVPFTFNEHNQLFINLGGNTFAERGAELGFRDQAGLPPENAGAATLTWAIAAVDYDLDGDTDILTFDDQGVVPIPAFVPPIFGSVDYGFIHLFENDGAGRFTDRAVEAGLDHPGNWMGVSFGDFNCDGHLDFFGTNVGDYPAAVGPAAPYPLGTLASRWYLGQGDGTFSNPGVGELVATPFGWGTSVFDYDNDGDSDIVFHGAIDAAAFIDAGNPGAVLQNQGCTGDFVYDAEALAGSADHARRTGQGLATGDLDGDGFRDLVTVSNFNIPDEIPLERRDVEFGGPFDATSFFVQTLIPTDDPTRYLWDPIPLDNGTLTLEISDGANGNGWASVGVRGSVGVVDGARANRDGFGAVVTLTTAGGKRQMVPIVGGASYASQDAPVADFGLGEESEATVEVLWPGGVKNRFRGLEAGERIVLPEIPCDVDDEFSDREVYVACIDAALAQLQQAGVVDGPFADRLRRGAFACDTGEGALCLGDGQFQVEVEWRNFQGMSGQGQAVPLAGDTSGFFWFFAPDNLEMLVKVLDGCENNQHFWVFAAAATNVEYTLRVTDVINGVEKTWHNPLGEVPEAIVDTRAFATCP